MFVLLCVFKLLVPCCGVRYAFHIKPMFGSSLPPVVCRSAHIIVFLCIFAYSDVQHFVLSNVFTFLVPCCDVRNDFRDVRFVVTSSCV